MNPVKPHRRIRVLHIVGGMTRGGIETWLMDVLRHVDRSRFEIDLMVHTDQPCPYDDEVRKLGRRLIPCLGHSRPWEYARNFRRILTSNEPYDIVHSHVHFYSGYTLRLAKQAGVPVRIAHSHNDSAAEDRGSNLFRRMYLHLARQWLRGHSTHRLAASGKAAGALFGPAWQSDSRCRVLYCGIDLHPFRTGLDPSIRAELKIPADAFVIGHVGRFVEQKNQRFLLEIARSVREVVPGMRLLLIGEGPMRSVVERRAAELGLARHVVFAGSRPDVARMLLGAMNVFVMPSLNEGLPLVGLEAQAAGLPCDLTDTITRETDVLPQLVTRMALSQPASAWANTVIGVRNRGIPFSPKEALARMKASPLNSRTTIKELENLYAGACALPEESDAK